VVNLEQHIDAPDVNMITCGGQATIPMVAAVSAVTPVPYAEIVATIASLSAGPGTRESIDAFTRPRRRPGGDRRCRARQGDHHPQPADPPLMMRDTVFCQISPDADRDAILARSRRCGRRWRRTCPATAARRAAVRRGPGRDLHRSRGRRRLPAAYAGNLDIMTAAAVAVGEQLAEAARAHRGDGLMAAVTLVDSPSATAPRQAPQLSVEQVTAVSAALDAAGVDVIEVTTATASAAPPSTTASP